MWRTELRKWLALTVCGSSRHWASQRENGPLSPLRASSVLGGVLGVPPLDSEMGWTGQLWSNINTLMFQI